MSASSTSAGSSCRSAASISPGVLAHLGRNPVQSERLVDLALRARGDDRAGVEPRQAVFVQRQSLALGALAQGDIVFLAAREILHRRAPAFFRERAHIDLDAFQAESRARLVCAMAQNFMDSRMRDEAVERSRGARSGHQQIQVAHGLLAAAQAAGRCHVARRPASRADTRSTPRPPGWRSRAGSARRSGGSGSIRAGSSLPASGPCAAIPGAGGPCRAAPVLRASRRGSAPTESGSSSGPSPWILSISSAVGG
jgi:hypothetical protein